MALPMPTLADLVPLGPEIFETEGDVPWISIGARVALGVLAYSISMAVEPPPPLRTAP